MKILFPTNGAKLMKCKFASRSECVQMEPSPHVYNSRNGKVAPSEWSPGWCLPQRLQCQSQFKEALKNKQQVFLSVSMCLMLVLGGLYIYIPVAPSRCGCYGGFNASFGNASFGYAS